jgi:hypothetical protein
MVQFFIVGELTLPEDQPLEVSLGQVRILSKMSDSRPTIFTLLHSSRLQAHREDALTIRVCQQAHSSPLAGLLSGTAQGRRFRIQADNFTAEFRRVELLSCVAEQAAEDQRADLEERFLRDTELALAQLKSSFAAQPAKTNWLLTLLLMAAFAVAGVFVGGVARQHTGGIRLGDVELAGVRLGDVKKLGGVRLQDINLGGFRFWAQDNTQEQTRTPHRMKRWSRARRLAH